MNINSYIVLKDSSLIEKNIYTLYLRIWDQFINQIDYGEFKFNKKLNLVNITKIISNPSNVYYKFTIVEL